MFGAPNDEAFVAHPLHSRGVLVPYRAFMVENSSWLRSMDRMNAAHSSHNSVRFLQQYRHFVFAFHDSTFECLARRIRWSTGVGSLEESVPLMLRELSTEEPHMDWSWS